MSRIKPLAREDVPATALPVLKMAEDLMGFTPNDVLTMAKWPPLLQGLAPMVGIAYGPGEVSLELKRLVGFIASTAGGCRYCQAHTLHAAGTEGASAAKLEAVWEYATSPLFSEAERAALKVAQGGGSQPNGVTDADFAALREHFSEQQILEIVAVIALFGFLNRWNETLATTLEAAPGDFAAVTLQTKGWERGCH